MAGLHRAVPFRCQGKIVGRSGGRSAVATAAYNARGRLERAETGEEHDYRRGHSACTFSGIFAEDPPNWLRVTRDTSPAELRAIRERLWNDVERIEHRKNSPTTAKATF